MWSPVTAGLYYYIVGIHKSHVPLEPYKTSLCVVEKPFGTMRNSDIGAGNKVE